MERTGTKRPSVKEFERTASGESRRYASGHYSSVMNNRIALSLMERDNESWSFQCSERGSAEREYIGPNFACETEIESADLRCKNSSVDSSQFEWIIFRFSPAIRIFLRSGNGQV